MQPPPADADEQPARRKPFNAAATPTADSSQQGTTTTATGAAGGGGFGALPTSKWGAVAAGGTPHQRREGFTPTPRQAGKWDAVSSALPKADGGLGTPAAAAAGGLTPTPTMAGAKRGRWDQGATPTPRAAASRWDQQGPVGSTPTPSAATPGQAPSRWDQATPSAAAAAGAGGAWNQATPSFAVRKWDATPSNATPTEGATPSAAGFAPTPTPGLSGLEGATPMQSVFTKAGPSAAVTLDTTGISAAADHAPESVEAELAALRRNAYMTDEEIEALMPPVGFTVLAPPADYLETFPARSKDDIVSEKARIERLEAQRNKRLVIPTDLGEGLPELRPEDAEAFDLLIKCHSIPDAELPKDVLRNVQVCRNLLKMKNGDAKMRKSGMRQLTEKAVQFGADVLFTQILSLLQTCPSLTDGERHSFLKLVDRIIYRLGPLVEPHILHLLTMVQPLLTHADAVMRDEGKDIITNLARATGLKPLAVALRPDVENENDEIRRVTSKTLAIVAQSLGVEDVIPFLQAICQAKKKWFPRQTGVRVVNELASSLGSAGVRRYLTGLVKVIQPCLNDDQIRVSTEAATALAQLAETAAPFGIEAFADCISTVREQCNRQRGKALTAVLRAMGSLVALMSTRDAVSHVSSLVEILNRNANTPEDDLRRTILKVIQQCATCEGVTPDFVKTNFVKMLFDGFWNPSGALDRRSLKQLIDATVDMSRKIGCSVILQQLVERVRTPEAAEIYQRACLEAMQRSIDAVGTNDVFADQVKRLVDVVFEAFQTDVLGTAYVAVHCLVSTCRSLGPIRFAPYVSPLLVLITSRMASKVAAVRKQAGELCTRMAATITACRGQTTALLNVAETIVERLSSEEDPPALATALTSIQAILAQLPNPAEMRPPLSKLTESIFPLLKHRSEEVQDALIGVIGLIAKGAGSAKPLLVHAGRLMGLAMEGLFFLLKAKRRATRVATIEAFGEICATIGPTTIVKQMLSNLKKEDRGERICTEVSLAVVAKRCGPFTVIPFLVNEFKLSEGTELAQLIQQSVLKCLRFVFEYLGPLGEKYVYSVIPLLERSLTERNPQIRRMGCEVVHQLLLCISGGGYEDVAQHLLNYVHPNLITPEKGKEQLRLISSSVECMLAAQLSLGPGYILPYLTQGLFHPARRIRAVYSRAYNHLIACGRGGDGLVPYFPAVKDTPTNLYERHMLQYIA